MASELELLPPDADPGFFEAPTGKNSAGTFVSEPFFWGHRRRNRREIFGLVFETSQAGGFPRTRLAARVLLYGGLPRNLDPAFLRSARENSARKVSRTENLRPRPTQRPPAVRPPVANREGPRASRTRVLASGPVDWIPTS